MKNIEVIIDGEAYPCKPTAGAMLRFKQETGKEVSEFDATSFTEMFTFLWCCMASACAREKKPFRYTVMELADALDPEVLTEWMGSVQNGSLLEASGADSDGEGEKKRP